MSFSLDQLVLDPCIAAFGEAAQGQPQPSYISALGQTFAVDGVFDEEYREVDLLAGPSVTSSMPVFGCRLSQFPAEVVPLQGDGLVLRGNLFLVREVRPDGHGHVKLMLNSATLNQLPAPAPVGRKGIVIGDYTIMENDAGALVILTPDGGSVTLVAQG